MITGCIVSYKNNIEVLKKAVDSVLASPDLSKLYIIDNSPSDELKMYLKCERIEYIHTPSNPGFGAAHNIAIKKAIASGSRYHFIVNPDIEVKEDVFTTMVTYMDSHSEVGMMMPQILNADSSFQNLPKLLPHPFWVFRRKLNKLDPFRAKFIERYELRLAPKDKIYNVPILSGCFTLVRLDAIKDVGMYDENFFMYFEDFDLSRRMHQKYKTLYFPEVSVYHGYAGGANKSLKLFKIFLKSMCTYFNKWGWFFDKERKQMNRVVLEQFK